MLIFGPEAAPTISAVTLYLPTSAGSLTTFPSSTIRTAGSVKVDPTSPASKSTVRTSSTDAFSCLPPQRTIAYTRETLSPLGYSAYWGAAPVEGQRPLECSAAARTSEHAQTAPRAPQARLPDSDHWPRVRNARPFRSEERR